MAFCFAIESLFHLLLDFLLFLFSSLFLFLSSFSISLFVALLPPQLQSVPLPLQRLYFHPRQLDAVEMMTQIVVYFVMLEVQQKLSQWKFSSIKHDSEFEVETGSGVACDNGMSNDIVTGSVNEVGVNDDGSSDGCTAEMLLEATCTCNEALDSNVDVSVVDDVDCSEFEPAESCVASSDTIVSCDTSASCDVEARP